MMQWLLILIAGLLAGHLVRRLTPRLLGEKNNEMPFSLPFVEILGAGLFALLLVSKGLTLSSAKWYLFTVLLMAIGSADAFRKYVPTTVCKLGTVAGLVLSFLEPADISDILNQGLLVESLTSFFHGAPITGLILAISGALMGFFMIWFIRRIFYSLAGIEAMGLGDAYIMMMAGAFIGPQGALFSLLPACFIGILIGLARKALYGVSHLAFGPALGFGAFFILLYSNQFTQGIVAFSELLFGLSSSVRLIFSLVLVFTLIVLILRLRRKAAEYEQQIESDYEEIDKKMNK